ncbi:50S ribosomal protein L28 [Algimonas ampicilliniresistens]|uniref:Large ribosomal subunit protein bL28 n=2 Tax=Algimonas ampicilliniresistens TaxID=1298735 RepID=A0ABQ5VDH3_9PROT|nr:50S ribosomal protein L28 [Algimonas ampicilliniresistens]
MAAPDRPHLRAFFYSKRHELFEASNMSRTCDLLGTGPMSGHNVSHSNIKSKRRFEVNLCNVTLRSDALGQDYRMRIAAKTLRTVDFKGGLDGFLMGTKNHKLTDKARTMKKAVAASIEATSAPAE